MKKFIFGALFLLMTSTSFAVLPPFYHSVKEIQAIIDDDKLHENLGSGQLIQNIIKTTGGWIIITPKYYMRVDVEYLSSDLIGATDFKLHFHDPIEIS